MKKVKVDLSVAESAERIKQSLQEKGFTLFCDIDHQANANSVDLELPAARALIFGNPLAGTKLMQKDIAASLDLPLRISVVEDGGDTLVVHMTTEDYCRNYQLEGHPVLEKIEQLFAALVSELSN
ncbi:DUF302 domain-containing protein [Sessilibacter corallicola]|uniref:DUF302 domain-containing protein n=1 Tax=Sessilibacter corallicola TaxID=2904075 RepID=UPI001E4C869A|nr:DUF302 domain-containing protein [Sessilibacter corallicola]MCE2028828.1 DUF302 domain-containing protein [Sessilibacter corallicola]